MLVLSVSSLKGGVGKTSVTLGLASAAYSRGIPTLVVDVDPQADASTGLDVPVTTEVDIADVLAAPKSRILDRAVVPSGWVGDRPGHIDVIPGSPRAAEFDRPSLTDRYLRRLKDAIAKVSSGYRLVLIDCPPSLNGLTRAAWTASDRVLIVTEPGLFSVAAADRALRATEELRRRNAQSLQPLGIVVNRVRPNSREHAYRFTELKEMFGPLVITPPLPERTVLQQAQGSARPIHSWPGRPAAELASAFDRILDRALRSEKMRRPGAPQGGAGDAATGDSAQNGPSQESPAKDDAAPGSVDAAGVAEQTDDAAASKPSASTTPPEPGTEKDGSSAADGKKVSTATERDDDSPATEQDAAGEPGTASAPGSASATAGESPAGVDAASPPRSVAGAPQSSARGSGSRAAGEPKKPADPPSSAARPTSGGTGERQAGEHEESFESRRARRAREKKRF
ncbi:AAA family ATPase [Brevibacterium sp. NPDC049920]|uniref:AAA domain-containing protein n=1 Tax=Brevibacterium pityocampae TaxID=506594 RepID=A0ABP8JCG0_9MICO